MASKPRGVPGSELKFLRELIDARLEAGDVRTARELAERIGIDPAVLSRFRRGKGLDFHNLDRFARYLGFASVGEMLGAPDRPALESSVRPIREARGFVEAFAEARAKHGGRFPEYIWAMIPKFAWEHDEHTRMSAELIASLASALYLADSRAQESGTMIRAPAKTLTGSQRSKRTR